MCEVVWLSVCQSWFAPLINIFLQPTMSVRHYRPPRADHLDLHLGVARGTVQGSCTGVHTGEKSTCVVCVCLCAIAGRGVRSVPNTAEMDGGQ